MPINKVTPTEKIPPHFEDLKLILELHELVEDGVEFPELALIQDYLVNRKKTSPMQELVCRGVVKVLCMVYGVNGKTAVMMMNHLGDTDLLRAYFGENPEQWKLIKDGFYQVVLGKDVLSQMLGSSVAAWVRDADVAAAQELYVKSMSAKHGKYFENIEDVLRHIGG